MLGFTFTLMGSLTCVLCGDSCGLDMACQVGCVLLSPVGAENVLHLTRAGFKEQCTAVMM